MSQPARPTSNTITIEFPSSARLPSPVLGGDQRYLRYLVAGALYANGTLSGREARQLTGDSRRAFEETMAEYGFPLMPDSPEDLEAELNA